MSATTAESGRKQTEYLPYVQLMFKEGVSIAFPCGNVLFDAIIRVNCARGQKWRTKNEKRQQKRAAKGVLAQITGFDAVSWAEGIIAKAGLAEQQVTEWTELGRAYQLATLLYCLRWLYDDRARVVVGGAAKEVVTVRNEVLDELLVVLKGVQGRKVGRLTLWPLIMAGLDMRDAEKGDRRFVCAALSELSGRVGAMSPADGVAVLESCWGGVDVKGGVFC